MSGSTVVYLMWAIVAATVVAAAFLPLWWSEVQSEGDPLYWRNRHRLRVNLGLAMLAAGLVMLAGPLTGVAGWEFLALAAIAMLCVGVHFRAAGAAKRTYRRRSGRCERCNYDLTGNVSGRCPECGCATGGLQPR